MANLLGARAGARSAAAPGAGENIAHSLIAASEFSKGMAAYTSGDYNLAARCFNAAIAARHDAADAHYYLGLAYLNSHRVEDAVDCFVMATHFRPAFAPAWYSLAMAVRQCGDHREAVRCLERAIMLRPDYAEAYNELGVNTLELGDVQHAVASFERAIAIKPDYLRAHSNLGCVLFRDLGEYERGTAHIDTALGLDKHDSDAQCNYSKAGSRRRLPCAISCWRPCRNSTTRGLIERSHCSCTGVLRRHGPIMKRASVCAATISRVRSDFQNGAAKRSLIRPF
jgi:tetratricopeptide (TPR) repeat protein